MLAAARSIGTHINRYAIVVTKSTVPVGTADKVRAEIEARVAERGVRAEFDVVSNPEFLKEGVAIQDFMRPDRVVIGTENPRTQELMRALYEPFTRNHDRLIVMDIRSSELTKYAANAMLATKISFMNELANIAERCGADIEKVRIGIGSDPRIGYSFIYPGTGYGGSCFPKDVQALIRAARAVGHEAGDPHRGRVRQPPAEGSAGAQDAAAFRRWPEGPHAWRSGGLRSSPTPTTCARHRPHHHRDAAGRPAPGCAPTIRSPQARRQRIFGRARRPHHLPRMPTRRPTGADALGDRHRVAGISQPRFRAPEGDADCSR